MKRKHKYAIYIMNLFAAICIFLSIAAIASAISVAFATLAGMGRVLYDMPIGMSLTLGYAAGGGTLFNIGLLILEKRDKYEKKIRRTGKS